MRKREHSTGRNGLRNSIRRLFKVLVLGFLVVFVYLTFDYFGPSKIPLKEDTVFGFTCLRASDLIVQEFDKNGDLWATRGMIVYRLKQGETKFARVSHVPTGFSVFWVRNFSLIRKLTIRPECIEITVTDKGDICALSAGKFWLRPAGDRKFFETIQLQNYGLGDQGIRNDGILSIGDSTIYFGEYFQNEAKSEVKVYRSAHELKAWDIVYEFKPGQIRHIHAIQQDPYTERLWICTGDSNDESMLAWTDNAFETINSIGQGSQLWRICQLVFTEESVYWGTDTGNDDVVGIYRWDKQTKEIHKLQKVDGAVFYGTRLANGTIVMSTDREGMQSEKDDKTRLFIITDEDHITTVDCGTWNHNKPGFWFKFSKLRFQRNQGSQSLVISCLNQKEIPDGDLIIISEDTLLSVVKVLKDQ